MKNYIILIISLSLISFSLLAQITEDNRSSNKKLNYEYSRFINKKYDSYNNYSKILFTKNADYTYRYLYVQKHSYDILNYKLSLDIYNCFKPPYPRNFTSKEQITLRVDSALSAIILNAVDSCLSIDSVKFSNGFSLLYSHSSDKLSISLNRLYSPGEIINLDIYYRHNNVLDKAFIVASGQVFTNCEEERARCWFPCWDIPTDKATTDVTVKVPSNVLLVGNGRLADSVKIADTIYYRWISRDPMSTYLIAIAGANSYVLDVRNWHKTSNPNDSIPVRFYRRSYQNFSGIEDTILMFATFFSQKFGDYPFEKICYADVGVNSGGAMENQTLITMHPIAWYDWFFVPHELAHQWFGDLVTCGTWADIWLNEGIATMCELLADEHFLGVNIYKEKANTYAEYYLSDSIVHNLPIYNPPGWPANIIYSKPACVLYMLRDIIGDTLFNASLRSYLNDTNLRYKNAVTSDLTAKINSVTGQDYSWFINEWIYQPGHPVYQNSINTTNIGSGNWRLNYTVNQVQTFAAFFKMPVEIKVKFTDATDTLLKFFNGINNQFVTYDFNKQPDTVIFDPDNKIILKKKPPPVFTTNTADFCSNGISKPINDLVWTADTIIISQNAIVKDIEVLVNINHGNDGDLLIRLENPVSGMSLSQFNGAGGQNYTNTVFDDSASTSITMGTPPFTGRFRPQFSFSSLLDHQLSGKWILRIYDKQSGNQGTLLNWCIRITYLYEVGINENNSLASGFKLFQNYPNPFNPVTNIKYQIAKSGYVTLKIYDILGREVETLVSEFQKAGVYETQFPGNSNSNLASGIYFYRLTAGDFKDVKRMLMIK